MNFEDLLSPPHNSILLRVVPSTAITVGGKLIIPHKGIIDFFKNVTLASTVRKSEAGKHLLDQLDVRGDHIAELLECCPGSTGIIVASSYGISLLLHDDANNVNGQGMLDEVVKLSHGCLLVLIETRNNPALFNVDVFVQRLQHITGDADLSLKEPPKLLYEECEGNFVVAPLKDAHAIKILQALEKIEVEFFINESQFSQIVSTIKKHSIGWVWPRLLLYVFLDADNRSKWAVVLQKLIPSLPSEEKKLISGLLEKMKPKFGDYTPKQDPGVATTQMMLIQPLITSIIYGQIISPVMFISMCDTLFKRATLASKKYISTFNFTLFICFNSQYPDNSCISRSIPKLAQKSIQNLVDFTVISKSLGATNWISHSRAEDLTVKPQTQINFQIRNQTPHPVCWQVWNFSSDPTEKPTLLLPYPCNLFRLVLFDQRSYRDQSSIANLIKPGALWTHAEEGNVTFEMSDEGIEKVVLFSWWKMETGEVYYEQTLQQIRVAA